MKKAISLMLTAAILLCNIHIVFAKDPEIYDKILIPYMSADTLKCSMSKKDADGYEEKRSASAYKGQGSDGFDFSEFDMRLILAAEIIETTGTAITSKDVVEFFDKSNENNAQFTYTSSISMRDDSGKGFSITQYDDIIIISFHPTADGKEDILYRLSDPKKYFDIIDISSVYDNEAPAPSDLPKTDTKPTQEETKPSDSNTNDGNKENTGSNTNNEPKLKSAQDIKDHLAKMKKDKWNNCIFFIDDDGKVMYDWGTLFNTYGPKQEAMVREVCEDLITEIADQIQNKGVTVNSDRADPQNARFCAKIELSMFDHSSSADSNTPEKDMIIEVYDDIICVYLTRAIGNPTGFEEKTYFKLQDPNGIKNIIYSYKETFAEIRNIKTFHKFADFEINLEKLTSNHGDIEVTEELDFDFIVTEDNCKGFISDIATPGNKVTANVRQLKLLKWHTTNQYQYIYLISFKGNKGERQFWEEVEGYFSARRYWQGYDFEMASFVENNDFAFSTAMGTGRCTISGNVDGNNNINGLKLWFKQRRLFKGETIVSADCNFINYVQYSNTLPKQTLQDIFKFDREAEEEKERKKDPKKSALDNKNNSNGWLRTVDNEGHIWDYTVDYGFRTDLNFENVDGFADWYEELGNNVSLTVLGLIKTVDSEFLANDTMLYFKGDDGEKWFDQSSISMASDAAFDYRTINYIGLNGFDGNKITKNYGKDDMISLMYIFHKDHSPHEIFLTIGDTQKYNSKMSYMQFSGNGKSEYESLFYNGEGFIPKTNYNRAGVATEDNENDIEKLPAELGGEEDYASALYELGLFRGTDNGFELDKTLTREQAAAMIVRLTGNEEKAMGEENKKEEKFKDVGKDRWSYPYVMFCYENGITKGTGTEEFSPAREISGEEFITLVLRTLGFDDAEPETAYELANFHSLINPQKTDKFMNEDRFTRGDMVYVCYRGLKTRGRNGTYLPGSKGKAAENKEKIYQLDKINIYEIMDNMFKK